MLRNAFLFYVPQLHLISGNVSKYVLTFCFKWCDWVLLLFIYLLFMGNWEKPLVVFCTDNLEFCICIFPFGFLHDFKDFGIVYVT